MFGGTVLILFLIGSQSIADEPSKRPNVLFITIDDLNHWVGHLGRNKQVQTPNIDRLAARGVTFTRAYCAAPLCNPSRAALLSGLRPSTTGVYDNPMDWRKAIPEALTLQSHLRKHGYFVAGAGKIYHGGFDRRSEWDDYFRGGGGTPAAARRRRRRRRDQVRAARLQRRRIARLSHHELDHRPARREARQAILPGMRAAQAAHAVERAAANTSTCSRSTRSSCRRSTRMTSPMSRRRCADGRPRWATTLPF